MPDYLLVTKIGFFRKSDPFYPDILMGLFSFIGIVLFGTIPLWICYVIVLGTCFVYQFTIIKRTIYPLKWIVHTGIFVLLLPIHPGTIAWAILAGIAGIFLNSLDRLRIQIPLSLIQLLIFLFFYLLLPTVDIFSGIAGKPSLSFRDESISDIFSVLSFSQEGYSPLRFSSLETMGAYSILFLIPVFLKSQILFTFLNFYSRFVHRSWKFSLGIFSRSSVCLDIILDSFRFTRKKLIYRLGLFIHSGFSDCSPFLCHPSFGTFLLTYFHLFRFLFFH